MFNEDKTLITCGGWADLGTSVTTSRCMLHNELKGAISVHRVIMLVAPRLNCRKLSPHLALVCRAHSVCESGPGTKWSFSVAFSQRFCQKSRSAEMEYFSTSVCM